MQQLNLEKSTPNRAELSEGGVNCTPQKKTVVFAVVPVLCWLLLAFLGPCTYWLIAIHQMNSTTSLPTITLPNSQIRQVCPLRMSMIYIALIPIKISPDKWLI